MKIYETTHGLDVGILFPQIPSSEFILKNSYLEKWIFRIIRGSSKLPCNICSSSLCSNPTETSFCLLSLAFILVGSKKKISAKNWG